MSILQSKWSNTGGVPFKGAPSGTINGSNTNFTITHTPKANSLLVFVDGVLDTNYTFNSGTKTITFTTAPAVGQSVYVSYSY